MPGCVLGHLNEMEASVSMRLWKSNGSENDSDKYIGTRTETKQDDNPFEFQDIEESIVNALAKEGFKYQKDYNILCVPNIVDISYGRGVGYTFTQHDLGKDIHDISATKIRAEMREQGKL